MKVSTAPYVPGAAQQAIDKRNAYGQSLGLPSQAGTFQPRPMAGAPSMMPMMPTNFFGAPRMNANPFDRRGGMGRGPMQNQFMPQVLPSRVGIPGMFGMMPQPDFMSPRGAMTGGERPAQMPINMAALSANPMGGAAGPLGGVGAMPPGFQPNFGGMNLPANENPYMSGGSPGNPGFPDPRTVSQTNTINPFAGAAPGGMMQGLQQQMQGLLY